MIGASCSTAAMTSASLVTLYCMGRGAPGMNQSSWVNVELVIL